MTERKPITIKNREQPIVEVENPDLEEPTEIYKMEMIGYYSEDGNFIRLTKCGFCKDRHSFKHSGPKDDIFIEKICFKTNNIIKLHAMIKPKLQGNEKVIAKRLYLQNKKVIN